MMSWPDVKLIPQTNKQTHAATTSIRVDKGSRGVICTLSPMSWIYVSYHIPYIHSNNYSKDQYELNKTI